LCWAAVAIVAGIVGTGWCAALGRRADRQAAELRRRWNTIAGRLERWLDAQPWEPNEQPGGSRTIAEIR
jgi:hypothetical protein